MPYSSRRWPAISRVLIPRAYIETILSSKPGNRRWYLAISCGSKVDRRSRGTSRSIWPVSVSTVFLPYPLRLLPSSSPPRWWSISAFNARSASAFFRPSRRPFGSKAVFGSAPASSWSRIASGIFGSLRRGMPGLLRSHHARPHTKFPAGPTPDGRTVLAPMPAGVVGHFGPALRRFVLAQYHQGQVTVPRLVAQLRAIGVVISKRQVVRLLNAGQDAFLAEAREVLRAGLATAGWVSVD